MLFFLASDQPLFTIPLFFFDILFVSMCFFSVVYAFPFHVLILFCPLCFCLCLVFSHLLIFSFFKISASVGGVPSPQG
jgi:hypothetical protein